MQYFMTESSCDKCIATAREYQTVVSDFQRNKDGGKVWRLWYDEQYMAYSIS